MSRRASPRQFVALVYSSNLWYDHMAFVLITISWSGCYTYVPSMISDFGPGNLHNNMALLYLQTPVELDQHINVICLPEQNEDFDSAKNCIANGWGQSVFSKY